MPVGLMGVVAVASALMAKLLLKVSPLFPMYQGQAACGGLANPQLQLWGDCMHCMFGALVLLGLLSKYA